MEIMLDCSLIIAVEGPLKGNIYDNDRGCEQSHTYYRAVRIDKLEEDYRPTYGNSREEAVGKLIMQECNND